MANDGIKSIGVIHNFLINVEGYSPDMLMQMQDLISDFLEDLFEMKGAFVISRGIKESQIYSKSIKDFSKITEIADVIATFDHNKFFKSISGPGFKQIDSIRFESYQIYFARITSTHAIFILFADSSILFDDVIKTIIMNLRKEMVKATQKIINIPAPITRETKKNEEIAEKPVEVTKFRVPLPSI